MSVEQDAYTLNSLCYLAHQKQGLLHRLQLELASLHKESQLDSDALLSLKQQSLEESINRLEPPPSAEEERENAVLRHTFQRTRISTDQLRMKTEVLMQHKARLYETIHTVVTTSNLMLKANDVESAKLAYVAIGRKDMREMNILQLEERRDKARTMAATLNEFLTEKAQKQLERSNLDEKLKFWRTKIDKYSKLTASYTSLKSAKLSELDYLRTVHQRILASFQSGNIDECIRKYERILSSNESLSSYINNLLIQLAEQRAAKRQFKQELRLYHHDSRLSASKVPSSRSMELVSPRSVEMSGRTATLPSLSQISVTSGIDKDLLAMQMLIFDAISSVKSTLTRIDRADEDGALGPFYPDLSLSKYEDIPDLEHCIGVLLLIERKLWQCKEIYSQRALRKSPVRPNRPKVRPIATLFISNDTGRKSILHTIDLKYTSQSVNTIKTRLFSTHFVGENETETSFGKPVGKIGSLLSDVARVTFDVSNKLRLDRQLLTEAGRSPAQPKDSDDVESAYLKTEIKRMKKDATEQRPPMHKHSFSLPSPKPLRSTKLMRGHNELDEALGIPQISRQIQELNRMALVYQKSLGHTEADGLKELYQEVCHKK